MQYLSSALYKAISMLMSLLLMLGVIGAPSADAPITTGDETRLSFVALGDTQVCNYNPTRLEALISAAKDFQQSVRKPDALLVAGDITENGCQDEYDLVRDQLLQSTIENFVFATGNHDIRLREYAQCTQRFIDFANGMNSPENAIDGIYGKYCINGYTFLVIGSDETRFEDAYISDTQLTWLDTELAAATAEGKPCFVVSHYPLKNTHGLPDSWGNPLWESGSLGDQSDAVSEIMNRYQNVFYLTGHLHSGFGPDTYQTVGNIHSINIPSLGCSNSNGDYNEQGIGYVVNVTDTTVTFAARNFVTGENLPAYNLDIPLV